MDDLINRKALIEKMLLQHEDYRSQGATDMALGYGSAICDVKQAPAVDAVEVVRCGVCKYYNGDGICEIIGGIWDVWDFCSDGVRRDNNEFIDQ